MKDFFFFFFSCNSSRIFITPENKPIDLPLIAEVELIVQNLKKSLPPGESYFPKLSNTVPYKILEHKLSTGKHPVFLNGDTWFQHIYRKSSAPNLCTPSLERRGVVADLVAFG